MATMKIKLRFTLIKIAISKCAEVHRNFLLFTSFSLPVKKKKKISKKPWIGLFQKLSYFSVNKGAL